MLASGSLVVSPAFAKSEVSMAIGDTGLQGLVALKKTKVWKYKKTFVILQLFHFKDFN